jgi:hypothetical protein
MTGKRTKLSDQAIEDRVLIQDRVRKNANLMPEVLKELGLLCSESLQKKDLIVIAGKVSTLCNVPLDRLAKRSRDCLICWFSEHWPCIVTTLREVCRNGVEAVDIQKDKQYPLIDSGSSFQTFTELNDDDFFNGSQPFWPF